jgi:hypothetical protein
LYHIKEETEREAKHTKESEHWLNQTCTSNSYTNLLEGQQQEAEPENTPKTS